MDEEYQNSVNQITKSNPWADFEPLDTPLVNNIHNQRTISKPEKPSLDKTQSQYEPSGFPRSSAQPARPNPFDQNFEHQSIQKSADSDNTQPQLQQFLNPNDNSRPDPQAETRSTTIRQQQPPIESQTIPQNTNSNQLTPAPQQPVTPGQALISDDQLQYQKAGNPSQPLQQVNTQQEAPVFINTEPIINKPSAFENIAWNSSSSGLEDYSQNLADPNRLVSAPVIESNSPIINQNIDTIPNINTHTSVNPDLSFSTPPQNPMPEGQSLLKKFGPRADTVINPTSTPTQKNISSKLNFKIAFKKFKLKYLLFAILALALIGGASFAVIKLRNNSVQSTKLKPESQIVAEDIIELAKNNKFDDIYKKYIRESNQASFPKDQFKESILKFSQASSGKLIYISENTAKIIVQPDTNPSDITAYIYTTNYTGYKGKIYIRVDVFKNSADGKWYMYALAYNSKELKPDLTAQSQSANESVPQQAVQ